MLNKNEQFGQQVARRNRHLQCRCNFREIKGQNLAGRTRRSHL